MKTATQWMQQAQEKFSSSVACQAPQVEFYEWNAPCFTFGITTKAENFFKEGILPEGVELAQRPTGGGLIYHDNDLSFGLIYSSRAPLAAYSVVESYRILHQMIIEALEISHSHPVLTSDETPQKCCQSDHTIYDTLVNNRKIIGSAQRRNKMRILHQVSIFLRPLPMIQFRQWNLLESICQMMEEKVGWMESNEPRIKQIEIIRQNLLANPLLHAS